MEGMGAPAEASLLASSVPKALLFLPGGQQTLGRMELWSLCSSHKALYQTGGHLGHVLLWWRGNSRGKCLLWSKSVLLFANGFICIHLFVFRDLIALCYPFPFI